MNIVVIDGQSGHVGAQIVETLRSAEAVSSHRIIAVGTNALATAAMLKAGADAGATGENPVVVQAKNAGVITGPIGILLADSLLGEITPKMAAAVSSSNARIIPVPVNQCRCLIPGTEKLSRSQLIENTVNAIISFLKG